MGESVVAEKPDQSAAEEQIFIYTHKSFDINYNAERVGATPCHTAGGQQAVPVALGALQLRLLARCRAVSSRPVGRCLHEIRGVRCTSPRCSQMVSGVACWLFCRSRWQIIQVNLTSETPRPVTAGTALEFTYSVKWEATDIPFRKRFNRYLDYNFFEHQVRGT